MPMPQEMIFRLYEPAPQDNKKPQGEYHRFSNEDLIKRLGSNALKMAAEVFLRPKMAMRYQLLPALAHEPDLQISRQYWFMKENMSERIYNSSLLMLLGLADPSWEELPKEWCYLGSFLDTNNLLEAQDYINDILNNFRVREPMKFLNDIYRPKTDDTDWKRFFWLTQDELNEFDAEKSETIALINKDDEEMEE